MNVSQVVDRLKADPAFQQNLTTWKTIPPRPARYAGFPEALHPRLVAGLRARGIHDLYTHQREAVDADDFRDYMLAFLFLRYLSDNCAQAEKIETFKEHKRGVMPQLSPAPEMN